MEIQHLRYFIETAQQKNFTRAAEALFITQPMLTRVIKQLESDMGVQLIERTSKSFHLTEAGEAFYIKSRELLLHYDDLTHTIEDVKSSRRGSVSLAIPGVLLDRYFAPLLVAFRRECPHVDISIIEGGSKQVAKRVEEGKTEIGLAMMPIPHMNRFYTEIILHDVACLIVGKDHPFAARASVPLEELQHERLITFSDTATLHDTLVYECELLGFEPNIIYKTMMPNFTAQLVRAGELVGVLPRPIILQMQAEDDQLVAVQLEHPIDWKIGVFYLRDGYRSFASVKLYDFIVSYFKQKR